jgi:hypothetical protein
MAIEPPYFANSKRAANPPASPVRTLLYLSNQGMVFKSITAFDSGTRLAIGLHLQKIRGDLGLGAYEIGLLGDHLLQLQGLVADCKIVESSPTGRNYQVTLIFDALSETDRQLLTAIERARRNATEHPTRPTKPSHPVIPGAGGLN